jgi:hypothetical protein
MAFDVQVYQERLRKFQNELQIHDHFISNVLDTHMKEECKRPSHMEVCTHMSKHVEDRARTLLKERKELKMATNVRMVMDMRIREMESPSTELRKAINIMTPIMMNRLLESGEVVLDEAREY